PLNFSTTSSPWRLRFVPSAAPVCITAPPVKGVLVLVSGVRKRLICKTVIFFQFSCFSLIISWLGIECFVMLALTLRKLLHRGSWANTDPSRYSMTR
ncbi:MAG: hypothetical protein ACI84R_002652, partial [Candidatus Azotimanducaceae bacterium]